MATEHHDTKTALILAAGELFAEHGFDGTSVRAIADKAGANVAAVNYHFGSKQDLYVATLRHVVRGATGTPIRAFLESPSTVCTPEAMRAVIRETALSTFSKLSSPDRPQWRFRLLLRVMFESPSGALDPVIDETFRPDVADLMALARRARPDLPERELLLWAFSFMGQVSFYMFVREPVLRVLDRRAYDREFLEEAADHVADVMVAALDLPGCGRAAERLP